MRLEGQTGSVCVRVVTGIWKFEKKVIMISLLRFQDLKMDCTTLVQVRINVIWEIVKFCIIVFIFEKFDSKCQSIQKLRVNYWIASRRLSSTSCLLTFFSLCAWRHDTTASLDKDKKSIAWINVSFLNFTYFGSTDVIN